MIETDSEARDAFQKYKTEDPLRAEVPPALLSAEHIQKYAETTGLVFPFYESRLKAASYGLPLEGHCVWWDDDNTRHDIVLTKRSKPLPGYETFEHQPRVTLKRNSILFVTLGPIIRLPNYLAARFNLRIKNVYRGFLVGSGPLVDPGFATALTCPIHNLTDADYVLEADDDTFAWIEFTKLSSISTMQFAQEKQSSYAERTLDVLLTQANNGAPIVSSIPASVGAAQREAVNAQKAAVTARNAVWGGLAGVVAIAATLFVLSLNLSAQNHALAVTGTKNYADDRAADQRRIGVLDQQIRAEDDMLRKLEHRIAKLEKRP